MPSTTLRRSLATLGVAAGRLAAASPASADGCVPQYDTDVVDY